VVERVVSSVPGLRARMVVRRSPSFELDVEVHVPAGRTVALLGPNGAGKSTAVAAIAGLLPLDEGGIELGPAVLDDPAAGVFVPPRERRVGVVFQDYLLFPHLSVLENVAFGLRSRGGGRERAREMARSWLERVGLGGTEERAPAELSGGQAQRVALARALASEPDVLLLDEPLAALDVTTRATLRRALAAHLEAFDGPRVLITHDPAEAFLLADEVHVVEDGSVTQAGTPDELRLRPRTRYAADLAGANLLSGTAADGEVAVDGHVLHLAERDVEGEVLVTIQPTAVTVHRERPEGSQRNAWPTTVERVERLGDRARVRLGPPLPLTVEVTRESTDELGLAEGREVWAAVKATEIGVEPDGSAE
ncbi:MAG TPA: ATP-binding cassette domain-containing protein, partial [Longimicrobiales bacterium]|nr:ATP-binding cassette domain-containing protein [Longimicrobiales bacterium]